MSDHEHVNRTKLFTAVFVTLVILTGISFWVANSSIMDQPVRGWLAMMIISVAKALLVIVFFMHLKWETNWKFVLTIPAAVMSTLLVLILVPDIGNRTKTYSAERQKFAAFELKSDEEIRSTVPVAGHSSGTSGTKSTDSVNDNSTEENYDDVPGEWGTVKGSFILVGEPPKPAEIDLPPGQVDCEVPMFSRSLVVDKSGGVKNIVVFISKPKELPLHPYYKKRLATPTLLDNKACRFDSHISLLCTSQKLKVSNSDQIGHNANITSFHDENNSNNAIPAGGSIELNLPKAETRPIDVKCTSHGWMKAYLMVRDEPYMAISNAKGEFQIKYFPAGEYQLQFWHENVGYVKGAKSNGNVITEGRIGTVKIKVEDGKTFDFGQIKLESTSLLSKN